MKQFTLSLEDELCTLEKYNINANELLVIRILLILQDDSNDLLMTQLLNTLRHINIEFRDILISLQSKGIILKNWKVPQKGQAFDPYTIPINKNFIKNLYRASYELGKELFEVYPQFNNINGSVIPLRGIAKKYDSLDDAYRHYAKSIRYNPEVHNNIIDLVKWAGNNNLINCSLATFIVDQKWNDLKALKEGESGINYDAVKLL